MSATIRQEWINLGNLPEDFREKGPKIIIILDNASYHKRPWSILQLGSQTFVVYNVIPRLAPLQF